MYEVQNHEHAVTPEQRPPVLRPRIYVASLSDYNAGRLHGVWLDAAQDTELLYQGIQEMLDRSPEPVAEEWTIHDYDDFAGLRLHEFEIPELLTEVARGLITHGPAFAALVEHEGMEAATPALFKQTYRGRWDTITDYAAHVLVDLDIERSLAQLPEWLRRYIHVDTAQFAVDMQVYQSVYTAPAAEGGVHVFSTAT